MFTLTGTRARVVGWSRPMPMHASRLATARVEHLRQVFGCGCSNC